MLKYIVSSWQSLVRKIRARTGLPLTFAALAFFTSLLGGGHLTPANAGATPHPQGCADDEIYASAQDWWMTTPGEVGEDGLPGDSFGHLHTQLCFPHGATISGEMSLDVTTIMHNNPGEFYKLMLQIWADGWSPDPRPCIESATLVCPIFDPPRTLGTCEASGGTLLSEVTCKWTDTLSFDTSLFPYDGYQQFRVRSMVDEPDGSEMRTSTGLHAYLANGNPVNHVYENPEVLEGRGWYTDANYSLTNMKDVTAEPVSGFWAPWVEMKPGAEGIPVTSHLTALNANAHAGDPGIELLAHDGPFEKRVMIDTTTLTNGWHKLVLKADQFEPISGSTNSSVFFILFEVLNQAPPTCDAAYVEPAVADAHVRGGGSGNNNYGDDAELEVKSSSSAYTRHAFIQFDLSGYTASSAEMAVLDMTVHSHDSPGTTVPLELYAVDDDSWDENTITWNNAPAPGILLGVVNVSDKGPISFDITDYVEAELAGDKRVSLVLLDNSGTNERIKIRSRTAENDPPTLTLLAAADECTPSGGDGPCALDADCDDGLFCNGAETCDAGFCQAGTAPSCDDGVGCTADTCNEGSDSCDSTASDALCDNGLFCDGAETCDAVADCLPGTAPDCDGLGCNEAADACQGSDPVLWMSFSSDTTVPGLAKVAHTDLVSYDEGTGQWTLQFDGSDVGLNLKIDGVAVLASGDILMSFKNSGTVGSFDVDDSDIVRFTPTSLGETTAGTFSLYFDASDVGLSANTEDVDALTLAADGRLILSVSGTFTTSDGLEGHDEDLLLFTGTLGSETSGTFEILFDGSDVDLNQSSAKDIEAVTLTKAGDLLFSSDGDFSLADFNATDEDVLKFVGTFGPPTSGTFSTRLDLSALGIDASEEIESLHIVD
jgi:hypothetical protein